MPAPPAWPRAAPSGERLPAPHTSPAKSKQTRWAGTPPIEVQGRDEIRRRRPPSPSPGSRSTTPHPRNTHRQEPKQTPNKRSRRKRPPPSQQLSGRTLSLVPRSCIMPFASPPPSSNWPRPVLSHAAAGGQATGAAGPGPSWPSAGRGCTALLPARRRRAGRDPNGPAPSPQQRMDPRSD